MKKEISLKKQIVNKIQSRGRGWVFLISDLGSFVESENTVEKAISRLVGEGYIQRLHKGLYYFPKRHPIIGNLQPEASQVAKALARRHGTYLSSTGAKYANELGLSTQVPAKVEYVTGARIQPVKVGNTIIKFHRKKIEKVMGCKTLAGKILLALEYLGFQESQQNEIQSKVRAMLNERETHLLLRYSQNYPSWLQEIAHQIVGQKAA